MRSSSAGEAGLNKAVFESEVFEPKKSSSTLPYVTQAAELSAQGCPDEQFDPSPLYGHHAGALKGDNPHKPERPSHIYHT